MDALSLSSFLNPSLIKLEYNPEFSIFINDKLCPTSALLSQIYEENKDEDGFLYIKYDGESTFG